MNYKEKEELSQKFAFSPVQPGHAKTPRHFSGKATVLGSVFPRGAPPPVGRGVCSVVWNYAQSLEEVADRPSIMLRAGFLTITI